MDGLFLPPERATALAESEASASVQRARLRRRLAFRWLGWGTLSVLLGQVSLGFLRFVVPKRLGTFGSTVKAGLVDGYAMGEVRPILSGKFYVTRVPEGVLALWWKCPHLGCTVQWFGNEPAEDNDRGFAERGHFKCPCHGSEYDRYGKLVRGPAPRPMDLFPVRIDATGQILVETGPQVAISRSRATPGDATAV